MKSLDLAAALAAHPLAFLGVAPQVVDGLTERTGILRGHEQPVDAVLEQITLSGDPTADHRLPHRHGLGHHGDAVVGVRGQERHDDEARAGVESPQLRDTASPRS